MKLKSGTIYIVKTKWGEVHEAEFRASVNGAFIFSHLPFRVPETCPRFITEEEIEWAEPICPMNIYLTGDEYNRILSEKFA